jgi:hypothetical protein
MRAWSPLIVGGVLFASCGQEVERGSAVEAALNFFEARQAPNCSKAWSLYSAGTQENIRFVEHRRRREGHAFPHPWTPEQLYCGGRGKLRRGTVRLVRQQGDEAVVAAEFVVRTHRHMYDFFPPAVVVTEELRLVREGGAWRVDLPRVKIGRGPHWRLVEIGPVDVFFPAKSFAGLADQLEATAVVTTPRDTLEPALRDPQSWARALPLSVTAVQPLPPTGELERVQLSFAEPDRSLTITTKLSGKEVDRPMQEISLQWNAEGGNKAPVYFRGSWRLEPHTDGSTRISLLLVLIRDQWPGDGAEGVLSVERMAQAVLDLEKAARKSAP